MNSNYAQLYGKQSAITQNLTNVLTPIVQAGPSQTGFSAAENAALNSEAINTTGAENRNATQAVGNELAGRGDNSGLASGTEAQIKASLASSGAEQLAGEQLGITKANYAQGNKNYNAAVEGLSNVAGIENPNPTASEANTAGENAFKSADTIQQQKQQALSQEIGAAEGLATSVLGGFGNLDTSGSSSAGEQAGNFAEGL